MPIFFPSSTSSSFYGNFSFFLSRSRSQAFSSTFSSHGQITYPLQAPISTTRTTRIKTLKHGLHWPTSTDLTRQHQSTSIKTHSHRLTNSNLAPTPIHWSTSNQHSTNLSLCWFVLVGVFVYLCVDLSVWMCLCVGVFVCIWGKRRWGRRSLRPSSFCTEKREKKRCKMWN